MKLLPFVRFIVAAVCCLAAQHSHGATYAERISATNFFSAALVWTGPQAPEESESRILWQLIEGTAAAPMTGEEFLDTHSNSPWAASLRANLAVMHRHQGRYTLALKEWEDTWNAVKRDTSTAGRSVAELTAAHWSQLLASLGRTETLALLFQETKGWQWQNTEWRDLFRQSADGYHTMLNYPGISYRCGTFALANIAKEFQPTNHGALTLIDIPSPTNGFPMSALVELAATNQLGLVAVERSAGSMEVVVPSVVHLRQNHYAAVLRRNGSLYWIADPTFGYAQWMRFDHLNEEASGKFLVPATNVPAGWRLLAKAETENVFGKGQPATIRDSDDEGCNKAPGHAGAPNLAGSSHNAGGNDSVCQPCLGGMARWWVSEPYCNLFISDEPLSYSLSDGSQWKFRFTLKQRDKYTIPWTAPGSYALDPDDRRKGMTNASLSHNWLSMIVYRDATHDGFGICGLAPNFQDWQAVVYMPDGGVRFYTAGADTESRSQVVLEPLSGTGAPTSQDLASQRTNGMYWPNNSTDGFRLVYPDGSQDVYNLTIPHVGCVTFNGTSPSTSRAFLTKRIDAQGRATSLAYDADFRARFAVDFDGRTNEFVYAATNSTRLTQVKDPFGRSANFAYDSSGRLTNLTDSVGLKSGLIYQSTNSGFVSKLITPYGTNSFTYYDAPSSEAPPLVLDQGNAGGHDRINRYVVIDEPDGTHEVYLYRYDSGTRIPASHPTNELPIVPGVTFDNGGSGFAGLQFRNSFYWGKKHFAAYPWYATPNPHNFPSDDYAKARMRHWLDTAVDPSAQIRMVTDRISMERAPSPDGTTAGQKTWYDYPNKAPGGAHRTGYGLIGTIATVLPDGTTQATMYDYYSGPTLTPFVRMQWSTFTAPDGSIAWRTNTYSYAANGVDLATHTFPGGAVERWTWNATHQLLGYTNAAQETTAFTYNSYRVSSIKLPNAVTTTFYYTNDVLPPPHPNYRMLSSFTDSQAGRTIYFPTWTNGLPRTVIDERGLNIANTWDGLNRLTGQSYSDGTSVSNRYSKLDLFATKDRLNQWTYFAHDSMQRLTAVTNANTNVTKYGYCGCGSLESITDALNGLTTLNYDLQLRVTNVVAADSSQWNFAYDALGRRTSATEGGRTTTFTYNNQGLPAAVSNSFGQLQRVVYDVRDRAVQITDAAGVMVTNTFDAIGRLLTRAYPDGGMEGFAYSTNGLVRHTNQAGSITRYAYDSAGRLSAITNANNEVTRFVYDAAGDLRQLIDGKNQTNKWNYDVFGRVVSKLDANGQTNFAFAYDANDRQTNRWTPAKGTTAFTYDPVGNLRAIDYPSSPDLAFDYDPLNRVKQMTDAAGTTLFAFTKMGQLASEDGPWGNDLLTNVYSQQLRMSSTLDTWATSYGYDSARRLKGLTNDTGGFGYTFIGASGLRSQLTLPNSASINDSYDPVAQLTNTTLRNSSSAILNAHGYTYDQWGQRNFNRFTDGSREEYAYDPAGQVKAAITYPTNGAFVVRRYAYDAAGNVSFRTNDTEVRRFTTDKLNQLTNLALAGTLTVSGLTTTNATNVTVNGVAATLDGNGNYSANVSVNGASSLTAIGYELYGRRATNTVPIAATLQYDANQNLIFDGKRGWTYDDENQLIAITETNAWKTEWTYDGFGRRRIRKEFAWTGSAWNQTNEVRSVFDGVLVLQERDSSNNPQVTYTRGLDLSGGLQGAGGIGGLLARTDTSGSAFYHADAGGNITALINSAQNLVAQYRFDPFGNVLEASGSMAGVNEMQFSSQPYFAKAGVSLYRGRPYSAGLGGRFTQADPLGEEGGINLHQFVLNDPINYFDPDGLAPTQARNVRNANNSGSGARTGRRDRNGRLTNFEERWREQVERHQAGERMRERGLNPDLHYLSAANPPLQPVTPGQTLRNVLPPCAQGQSFTATKRGGESDTAAAGRRAHQNYRDALGPNYDYNVTLPSGRRPDAVNWETRQVRELKPDHQRGIRRGERQVENYWRELEQITGETWTRTVDTYRPPQ